LGGEIKQDEKDTYRKTVMEYFDVSYKQRFFGVFLFEFILPYFLGGFLIVGIVYSVSVMNAFSGGIIVPAILTGIFIYDGTYLHFLRQIIKGLWIVNLQNDGIYGKKFWYKCFVRQKKFAEWDEIEEVRFIGGGLRKQNTNMGYIKLFKKDGTSFIICFFGVSPTNREYFFSKFMGEDGHGYNLEMMGIIAWKVGIEKFKNFPPLEGEPEVKMSRVKYILSIEGIRRVVRLIKEKKCKAVEHYNVEDYRENTTENKSTEEYYSNKELEEMKKDMDRFRKNFD